MTAHTTDTPTVTYRGSEGCYHVHLDGQHVGSVVNNWNGWTAISRDQRYAWRCPTRREATQRLVEHVRGAS